MRSSLADALPGPVPGAERPAGAVRPGPGPGGAPVGPRSTQPAGPLPGAHEGQSERWGRPGPGAALPGGPPHPQPPAQGPPARRAIPVSIQRGAKDGSGMKQILSANIGGLKRKNEKMCCKLSLNCVAT